MRRKLLAELAKASGGTSLSLADHGKLALPKGDESSRVNRLVIVVWHLPALMGLVMSLSIEWLLRKRRGVS